VTSRQQNDLTDQRADPGQMQQHQDEKQLSNNATKSQNTPAPTNCITASLVALVLV